MATAKFPITFIKVGREGLPIERDAHTPADRVQLVATGWFERDSNRGREIAALAPADAPLVTKPAGRRASANLPAADTAGD